MKWIGMLSPLLLLLAACDQPTEVPVKTNAHDALHALFAEARRHTIENDPLTATQMGVNDRNDELPEISVEAYRQDTEKAREFLRRLLVIDRSALDDQDLISYDIFAMLLDNHITEFEMDHHLIPFTSDTGFHIQFPRLAVDMPFETVKDYEDYAARLKAFPAYSGGYIELMKEGLAKGKTQPKVVVARAMGTFTAHVVDDLEKSVFHRPFTNLPDSFSEADRARVEALGEEAVATVVDGYRTLAGFMKDTYLAQTREEPGIHATPNGEAYYGYLIEKYTTLDMTAEQIHQKGLSEVARIREEMQAIIDEVGFEGSYAEFLDFLRTDPRFYAETPEELLARAEAQTRKMEAALPTLFGRLPKRPLVVEPVPDHLAPGYTSGRYVSAPRNSDKPGIYWVNTYDLNKRPLYTQEALTLHEGVPGHHLDNAISESLEDLPEFRRNLYLSAYGEGWGLYSERLGLEAGFYEDPYSNFGRLTYEMWRACRLVVDTGIHAMGWSKQKALDYMAENTALSLHEVETEIDRYISWPGQALSYKIGELEIRALRKQAEEALGDAFDVREFHDHVLENGSVPLPVLRKQIEAYIAEKKE